jgi:TolA-binding protein
MRSNLFILLRPFVLSVLCLSTGASLVWAQAPLVDDQLVVLDANEQLVLKWKADAAERALNSGLAGLAEQLYRGILATPGSSASASDLRIRLAASLIAQRRFVAARAVLEEVAEERRDDVFYLYRAVSYYGNGQNVDVEAFNQSLELISAPTLKSSDRPWLYLMQGLQAEMAGNVEQVAPAFEKAKSLAVSKAQRAFFDSLVVREDILRTPSNEALAAEIRVKLEEFSGDVAAYPYAREYAIIQYNLGRSVEAIQAIDRELANTQAGYGSREREQLLLLKGIILGADASSGRAALRELVRNGKNREVMGVALQLLARAKSALESTELSGFLNEMIARPDAHPLLGQMYYIRSQLALADGKTAVAEADARFLLEQFPGLNQIPNVYRLLAYAALQRMPAQYRAAADFLIQLRDQTEDSEVRKELNQLIGDCYFLNADYVNAVDFYQAARFRGVGTDRDGEFFLRLISAEVRAGQIELALQHIDEADFSGSISVSDRWRAEWNVAQALQANGGARDALKRVRLLLEHGSTGSVPAALDLRLRWLEARLALIVGEADGVRERVDALLARMESIPDGTLDASEARMLKTEMLLLKADILVRSGEANAGMEVLNGLRVGYAKSSAAERSYLAEANYHASINDFEAAQATLLTLASSYPASALAPQALFEAALHCERRGPVYFAEAVRVHNDLVGRYPTDPLYFAARLKQGDLLRQMNDFAGAQVVYENLINRFPEHPRRYVAELSRADCMLALARDNDAQLENVALTLERLIDIPNLPAAFQAEVGYKWGFALMRRDASDAAREVFSLIFSRFLLDGENAARLGPIGRYWMSRTLLELGALLVAGDEPAEARRVYLKMVAYNLPGRNLAQSRADALQVVEE